MNTCSYTYAGKQSLPNHGGQTMGYVLRQYFLEILKQMLRTLKNIPMKYIFGTSDISSKHEC